MNVGIIYMLNFADVILYIEDPCISLQTVNLTESWRTENQGSDYRPVDGIYACDKDLQTGVWFR